MLWGLAKEVPDHRARAAGGGRRHTQGDGAARGVCGAGTCGRGRGELDVAKVAQAIAEAVRLASYEYDVWKKKDEDAKKLTEVVIVEKQRGRMRRATQGMELGVLMAEGSLHARELVNEPGQTMRPRHLKEDAERIASLSKRVTVTVYDKEEARKMGMEAFLAVAQGSDEDPYFIHLRYTPKKATNKSIALVGKGITYDSGGLSLKPSNAMRTMKMDMGGAAAVLGVFSVIEQMAPTMEVHGIMATCENMPSGKAYRPGDIVRSKNGLSIEIDNTDAEGRVTLADSLTYAVELKPNAIIDMATLTGACMVALGEEIVGVMANDKKLAQKVMDASEESGEAMWELPLYEGYNKLIESQVADVKNVGSQWGGALTADSFCRNSWRRFLGCTWTLRVPRMPNETIFRTFRKAARAFLYAPFWHFCAGFVRVSSITKSVQTHTFDFVLFDSTPCQASFSFRPIHRTQFARLKRFENAQCFIGTPSHFITVHTRIFEHTIRINDECSTQSDAFLVDEDVVCRRHVVCHVRKKWRFELA